MNRILRSLTAAPLLSLALTGPAIAQNDSPFPVSTGFGGAVIPSHSEGSNYSGRFDSPYQAEAEPKLAPQTRVVLARDTSSPPRCVQDAFRFKPSSKPVRSLDPVGEAFVKVLLAPVVVALMPVGIVFLAAKGVEVAGRCTHAALSEVGQE